VKPLYTREALEAKIHGVMLLEGVVRPDGTVGDVQVARSLDPLFGLDQEALRAVRQWRFTPGMKDGKPVPTCLCVLELSKVRTGVQSRDTPQPSRGREVDPLLCHTGSCENEWSLRLTDRPQAVNEATKRGR
jgi:TonB family protein